MRQVILLLVVVLVFAISVFAQPLTYGQMATSTLSTWFPGFQSNFPSLTNSSQPAAVSALRKATLYVRDVLDVFPYAYPTPKPGQPDLWALIRGNMNDGYTVIGNFQDLNHSAVNYTQAEFDRLLGACLQWKANYITLNSTYNIENYLLHPDPVNYYFRDVTKYSEFFWQSVPFPAQPVADARPRNVTGIAAVIFLTHSLLTLAVERYNSVYNLSYVTARFTQQKNTQSFTTTESFISVATMFPLFPTNSTTVNDSIKLLNTTYGKFGDLNDNATAYLFYHDNKGSSWYETEVARLNVVIGWANLQLWMLDADIITNVLALQTQFLSPIPTIPPIPTKRGSSHVGLILGLILGLFLPLMVLAAVSYWYWQRRNAGYEMLERQAIVGRG